MRPKLTPRVLVRLGRAFVVMTALAGAPNAKPDSFLEIVNAQFATWDANGDGLLATNELNALVADTKITGRDAAAVAALKRASRRTKIKCPPLTLENLRDLAEGLAFAEALGVSPATALEVMTGSNAYSRAMDVKGRKMVERDFTVQARLTQHLKDVRLMLQAARTAGLELPLADSHRRLMEQAEAAGLGDQDNSAIIEVLRNGIAKPRP